MYAQVQTDCSPHVTSSRVQPNADTLVNDHLKLVRQTAQRVFSRISTAIEVDELTQIGMIALIEAARTYQDRGEATFATFAAFRIRGSMIDQLRKGATISRDAMKKRRQFQSARNLLEGQLCRPANDEEMAQTVNLPVAVYQLEAGRTEAVRLVSIDETYADNKDCFSDISPNALDALESERLRTDLAAAISRLPKREALAIQLHYLEGLDLQTIGQVFGVGAARVCQIKKAGLARLRAKMGGWRNP